MNVFRNLINSALKNKIFWYVCSRYFSLGLLFVASIFTANKLGVYCFGIWSFILLLFNIGSTCNWGVGNAATILLVQNKEDQQKAQDYFFNALLVNFFISLPPILFVIYDRIFGIPLLQKYDLGNGVYAVGVLIILSYFASLLMNVVRVKNRIWEITVAQTLWPVLMLSMLFLASEKFLLWGLVAAYLFSFAASIALYLSTGVVKFAGRFSLPIIRETFCKGFFLFLYNAGFTFIVLSTKMVVSKYYSVEEFGFFSFGFSLAHGILLMIDSLIFIVFPKMIDLLKGEDMVKVENAIGRMREIYLYSVHALLYLIMAGSWIFFTFVPKYSNSFEPFILIIFTLVMYSNCFAYNTFLLAHNQEIKLAVMVTVALVLNVALAWLMAYFKVRFDYIIIATLVTYGIYSLAVNFYALHLIGKRKKLLDSISARLLPLYIGALLLVTFLPRKEMLWIPLAAFIAVNFGKLKKTTDEALRIFNSKSIDV